MTFEEILKMVKEAEPFEHFATTYGMTFFAESYKSKEIVFALVMRHAAKGFESYEKNFLVVVGGPDCKEPQYIYLAAALFFSLREAINLNCNPWSENER